MMGQHLAAVQTKARMEQKTNLEVCFLVLKAALAKPEIINQTIFVECTNYSPSDISLIHDILYANFCTFKIIVMDKKALLEIKEKKRIKDFY